MKRRDQKGSGNPGTYYNGFGAIRAEYPHILLGGAAPADYSGYGLHASPYPSAVNYLTSPGFKIVNAYPEAFGRPIQIGGTNVKQITRDTHNYLNQSRDLTWNGLAKALGEHDLERFLEKKTNSTRINIEEQHVHRLLGIYWGSKMK